MIKKGDKYLCKLEFGTGFENGKLYISDCNDSLQDNYGENWVFNDTYFQEHFTKLEENNPMTYLDEAIASYGVKDPEIVTPKNDPIVSSVMFQLAQRSIVGQQKYGTTLQDNNTDDFLEHLKQELMDAILYIEKLQTLKK